MDIMSPMNSWAIKFRSDTLWSFIRMSESGVGFDSWKLQKLHDQAGHKAKRASDYIEHRHHFPLSGKGSMTGLRNFMQECINEADPQRYEKIWCAPRVPGGNPGWETHPVPSSGLRSHKIFTDSGLTPSGLISTTNLIRLLVQRYLGQSHPLQLSLTAVGIHTRNSKLRSSHTGKLLDKFLFKKSPGHRIGFVYPSWHITPSPFKDGEGSEGGTSNARPTATNPPIQTSPASVSRCFASRYNGGFIISMDLSQIELRIAALLSSDPYLLRIYREDRDLHTDTTVDIMGDTVKNDPYFNTGDNLHDPRQIYKQVNFLILYRGGPNRLIATVLENGGPLLSSSKAYTLVSDVQAQRTTYFEWGDTIVDEVRHNGYVRLPFTGQKRSFNRSPDDSTTKAIINYPVQATAANVLLRIQSYICSRLPRGVLPILNVYDSVKLDCPPSHKEELLSLIDEAILWCVNDDYWGMLQDHYGNEVPLKYGIEVK